MKFLLTFFFVFTLTILGQAPIEKCTNQLRKQLLKNNSNSEVLVWVMFFDKGKNTNSYYSSPNDVVSEKSLQRRSKVFHEASLLDITDIPVFANYIEQLQGLGFKLKQKSKWFNAVSGYVSPAMINSISELSFVKQIDLVVRLPKKYEVNEGEIQIEQNSAKNQKPKNPNIYDYGTSVTQLQQINVPAVHNLGFTGQGVTICVMDAGFNRLSHEVFSNMNIIAAYDFVNQDTGVGDSTDMGSGSHGTQTLSAIGGFKQGKLIGPAFNSNFILAKTENTDSETPIEEDNWIAALEWADSIGVDVTSTSLGYLDYDFPFVGYTWQNMDGNTARITIAADLAVKKGIVVLNSAGNEGFNSSRNTLIAPADGDSVIAVGAVNSDGTRSGFSSVGNTIDGRIKPDIMAMGSNVTLASPYSNNGYTTGSGTSFSCPLAAGVAALILSFNPSLTPMQVRDVMRTTASRSQNPDRLYGWGIIDALAAINAALPVELISFSAGFLNNTVILKWTTATETNSYGFSIERSRDNHQFSEIAFVPAAGNSASIRNYVFTDYSVSSGQYIYRLKQIDLDGTINYSNEVEIDAVNPNGFTLFQNYPNPFNPSTKIKYSVLNDSYVKMTLYDMLGNEISRLVEGQVEAGTHEVTISTNQLPKSLSSGMYLVSLESEGFRESIKINLIK